MIKLRISLANILQEVLGEGVVGHPMTSQEGMRTPTEAKKSLSLVKRKNKWFLNSAKSLFMGYSGGLLTALTGEISVVSI